MTVRYAPSPTGILHIGNLRTAWISHEWAKCLARPWIVRFENIDELRNVPGAREKQLKDLKSLGMTPDRVFLQSDHYDRHWDVFLQFHAAGLVYPCFCSRKMVRDAVDASASAPHAQVASYTGHCRNLENLPTKTDLPTLAWRVRMPDASGQDDFVIARTSTILNLQGLPDKSNFAPAYHWACAIDDHDENHSLLVRAWDLEAASIQQKFIFETLSRLEETNKKYPAVYHCSLIVTEDGLRLEKRTQGVTLDELMESGGSSQGIINRFESSFVGCVAETYYEGKIFGEKKRTLMLLDF